MAAMVGGVISWITGGTFANETMMAAFVHLFNAEGEHYDPSVASAGASAGGLIIVERAISSLVVSSTASAAPLLR